MTECPITLTPSEFAEAAIAGVMRNLQALRAHRVPGYGAEARDIWGIHIEGACGERAVAKLLDRYWPGCGGFRVADVGAIEVRTRSRADYDLLLYPRDRDDAIFVLVTGRAPDFTVRGWLYGHEGKRDEFWRDATGNGACYFVPADRLRDVSSLVTATVRHHAP